MDVCVVKGARLLHAFFLPIYSFISFLLREKGLNAAHASGEFLRGIRASVRPLYRRQLISASSPLSTFLHRSQQVKNPI